MNITAIKDWANQNKGFLTIILFLLGLVISWVLGLFKWIFDKFKKNTPVISAGGDLTNLQAGRDIVVKNQGSVALYSIEDVAKKLLDSVFGELPVETKDQIESNQKSYFQSLSESLGRIIKQNEELMEIIDSPDFQYISKNATISASRSSSTELHKFLSSLIVQRINNDREDLRRIVYDEAILTINKLTINQLKIITLCYLLRYTSYEGIVSWTTFRNYLNSHIKPFLDFKNTNAEFQHIVYAGCGSIAGMAAIGGWNLIDILRQHYSFVFFNLVEKEQMDSLSLPSEIKNEIVVLNTKEDKYFIRYRNKNEFEKFLKEKRIDDEIVIKLLSIYKSHIKSNKEVKNKILDETDIGKDLMNLWKESPLSVLSLTSVGIAIGATYFEQVIGEKINLNIWIN